MRRKAAHISLIYIKEKHLFKTASRPVLAALLFAFATTGLVAQVPGSALDYMLQRPPVLKHFDKKSFADRTFLEIGGAGNAMGTSSPKAGLQAEAAFGDWATPEHGWRVAMQGGVYNTYDTKAKFMGLSLDYLLNLSAVANRTYDVPKKFEVIGVAGLDVQHSRNEGHAENGLGFHVGLRGQYALSPYTYLYVEPRGLLLSDNISQESTWHNWRPAAALSVGVGYRLSPHLGYPVATPDSLRRRLWPDGLFVSLAGGGSFQGNANSSSWADYTGYRATFAVGKWFSPVHALRLSGHVDYLRQPTTANVKAIGGQLEYMANLHNVFGGYNPSRRWWINALAGAGVSASSAAAGKHVVPALSAGLQGNVRVSSTVDLFVEPRVDIYDGKYSASSATVDDWDIIPSLMFGASYTYGGTPVGKGERVAEEDFQQASWHDHVFIEFGGGLNVPIIRDGMTRAHQYSRPQAYVGVGKWLTSLHGVRLWAQASQTEWQNSPAKRLRHMEMGADYLFNISNALFGYNSARRCELSGGLGFNLSKVDDHDGLQLGFNASLRGTWHLNPLLALYAEPMVLGYGHRYLPSALGDRKVDFIALGQMGVQFNLTGYDHKAGFDAALADGGLPSRLSVAGGIGAAASHLRNGHYYGAIGRVAYEKWFTPLSAWRTTLQGFCNKSTYGKYAALSAGVDYMTDLTAHAYGYDPARRLTMTAFAGFNVGVDYARQSTRFAPDLHWGGQMAVRVSDKVRIFLEPQINYRFSTRYRDEKLARWQPQLLIGADYSFKPRKSTEKIDRPRRKQFFSVGMGTGAFTANLTAIHPFARKFTFVTEAAYGQWVTGIHGWQAAVSHTLAQRYGAGSEGITAVKAYYVMNMRSAITGEPSEDKLLQLTGMAGASLNFGTRPGRNAQIVPGVQAAMQMGFRLSPLVEVYLQPEAAVYSNRIEPRGTSHPADGELRLTLGTKFHF